LITSGFLSVSSTHLETLMAMLHPFSNTTEALHYVTQIKPEHPKSHGELQEIVLRGYGSMTRGPKSAPGSGAHAWMVDSGASLILKLHRMHGRSNQCGDDPPLQYPPPTSSVNGADLLQLRHETDRVLGMPTTVRACLAHAASHAYFLASC
jgi:hypothetical protein